MTRYGTKSVCHVVCRLTAEGREPVNGLGWVEFGWDRFPQVQPTFVGEKHGLKPKLRDLNVLVVTLCKRSHGLQRNVASLVGW